MEPVTPHGHSLAELVAQRNALQTDTTINGQMLNLSEEGHMFDHEPGHSDYHFDHHREHEDERHSEYYETARYPVFLDHQPESDHRRSQYNNHVGSQP